MWVQLDNRKIFPSSGCLVGCSRDGMYCLKTVCAYISVEKLLQVCKYDTWWRMDKQGKVRFRNKISEHIPQYLLPESY